MPCPLPRPAPAPDARSSSSRSSLPGPVRRGGEAYVGGVAGELAKGDPSGKELGEWGQVIYDQKVHCLCPHTCLPKGDRACPPLPSHSPLNGMMQPALAHHPCHRPPVLRAVLLHCRTARACLTGASAVAGRCRHPTCGAPQRRGLHQTSGTPGEEEYKCTWAPYVSGTRRA